MSSRVSSRRVFGRGSPVLDYWLGHSEGFELTSPGGGHRGVVQEVVIDELGYPRALVVRGGVLQRARVVDVDAVEAVVPSDGTITLRSAGRARPRVARPTGRRARDGAAALARTTARAMRLAWSVAAIGLTLAASAARRGGRRILRDMPAVARSAGRGGASAARWARPHAGRLARLAAAGAVTAALVVVTLAHALGVAIAAYARFVAAEWTRRRASARRAGSRIG